MSAYYLNKSCCCIRFGGLKLFVAALAFCFRELIEQKKLFDMNEKYPYFALKKYTCNTNCLKGRETYRGIEDGNITFSLVKKIKHEQRL